MKRLAVSLRGPEIRRLAIGVWAATLTVVVGAVSGMNHQIWSTLVIMGFDLDRAQMITSLLVGGMAAAVAVLAANRSRQATMLGLAAVAAMFFATFLAETQAALAATGIDGSFDSTGWLWSLVTLLVFGAISGWIGATLGAAVRPTLIEAGNAAAHAVAVATKQRRLEWRSVRTPAGVGIMAVLLVVTAPIFWDMVNYSPDSRMLHGAPPPVGLVPHQTSQTDQTHSPAASVVPSGMPQASTHGPTASIPPATSSPTTKPDPTKPWLAWLPTGGGDVTAVDLPAPWTGGPSTTETITIYTPPGYGSGDRLYPVLYQAPNPYTDWDRAINIRTALDTLIDMGAIPPVIVVFADGHGAPYPDTECADSADGKMWLDKFLGTTLVSYVDAHYRTIATQQSRAIMGFSQGGYCAAILALHHPTVFGTSIPISGYFVAGRGDATSRRPFAGSLAAIAAASPADAVSKLPATERANLYFVMVYPPSEPFYGPQSINFDRLLTTDGYPHFTIETASPHGWVQVRQQFPAALEAWAARMVATGVF
jgi:enterochelin esterase-like enzyme